MAISRYDVRLIVTNEDQGYQEDILDRRGIKKIITKDQLTHIIT